MQRKITLAAGLALVILASAQALDGKNGYTARLLFTIDDVVAAVGADFAEYTKFELLGPIGPGQTDAIAGDADGNIYFLFRARDTGGGAGGSSSALIQYDGTGFSNLVQDTRGDDGRGSVLEAVVVSPISAGSLTAGHPVLVRHHRTGLGGLAFSEVELVSVDPATGAETHLHSFLRVPPAGNNAVPARVAIDASGTASDGVIYVGPMFDGSIVKLTPDAGDYAESVVLTAFTAAGGLLVDDAGLLYTFAGPNPPSLDNENVVFRIDPASGAATSWATIKSGNWFHDWVFDDVGKLWSGLRDKKKDYVTEVPAGGTTNVRNRISEADEAWSIASGPEGTLYVMSGANLHGQGEVWELAPGSGGGGGGNGGGKGKPKK